MHVSHNNSLSAQSKYNALVKGRAHTTLIGTPSFNTASPNFTHSLNHNLSRGVRGLLRVQHTTVPYSPDDILAYQYCYVRGQAVILERIVEHSRGRSIDDVVQRKIFED